MPEEVAEKAVEGLAVAGDVATKADIAELEVRMVKWFFAAIFTAAMVIIAAVGLMIKFL